MVVRWIRSVTRRHASVHTLTLRGAVLGDLPGGQFWSVAWGVSADGSVVAGFGGSTGGHEAIRWTENSGMVGVGSNSYANDISADGSVIVGHNRSALGFEAFRWSGSGGVWVGELAGGDFGSYAWGVSADGSVVVGESNSAQGVPPRASPSGYDTLLDFGIETKPSLNALSAERPRPRSDRPGRSSTTRPSPRPYHSRRARISLLAVLGAARDGRTTGWVVLTLPARPLTRWPGGDQQASTGDPWASYLPSSAERSGFPLRPLDLLPSLPSGGAACSDPPRTRAMLEDPCPTMILRPNLAPSHNILATAPSVAPGRGCPALPWYRLGVGIEAHDLHSAFLGS